MLCIHFLFVACVLIELIFVCECVNHHPSVCIIRWVGVPFFSEYVDSHLYYHVFYSFCYSQGAYCLDLDRDSTPSISHVFSEQGPQGCQVLHMQSRAAVPVQERDAPDAPGHSDPPHPAGVLQSNTINTIK